MDFRLSKAERSKPQLIQTVPQPGSMAWFEARREGLNHQLVPFKSPPIPRNARNAAKIHGFCAAAPEVRIHFPPAVSPRTIRSAGDFTGSLAGIREITDREYPPYPPRPAADLAERRSAE